MPIPDFQTVLGPLLECCSDGEEWSISDAVEVMSSHFQLSDGEREQLLPSGQHTVIRSRTGWAKTYLKQAGLFEPTRRGFWRITARGLDVLRQKPPSIDVKLLKQFPEFRLFHNSKSPRLNAPAEAETPTASASPEEALEYGFAQLQEILSRDVIERIKSCSSAFFERLVVELLVKMGYGGSFRDAAEVVGRSGDGGIDGIIKEDKLGLDMIYVQAKRWEGSVGRPEIQKFVGALAGHGAQKGVFITTSSFTGDALEYARNRVNNIKIVLIDGEKLAELMMDHNLGVSVARVYEVKRIDSDYFTEE